MEDIKIFKSIITFTFSDNGEIGKFFVKLLKETFNAEPQDQSTYGIPHADITENAIREVCLEALKENTENYNAQDVIKIFKPTADGHIHMQKIIPSDIQQNSEDFACNSEVRRDEELWRYNNRR